MTLSPQHQVLVLFIASGAIIAGLGTWIFLFAVPALHTARVEVDNHRATIAAIQDQQSNLDRLRQQTSNIETLDQQLDQEIWSFLKEDSFFQALETIARANNVTLDEPKIKDVTPTGRPLSRPATLGFHGATTNLLRALDALQQTKPLIGIQSVTLVAGSSGSLSISALTVWQ